MKTKFRRLVSFLMAIAIVVSIAPMSVLAITEEDGEKLTAKASDITVTKKSEPQTVNVIHYILEDAVISAIGVDVTINDPNNVGATFVGGATHGASSITGGINIPAGETSGSIASFDQNAGHNMPYNDALGGYVITTIPVQIPADAVGTFTVTFNSFAHADFDNATGYEFNNESAVATITVEESMAEDPAAPQADYEIYYTLSNTTDTDGDKYMEHDVSVSGDEWVYAYIYLRNNTDETVTLQAYDIYLEYHQDLVYWDESLSGTAYKTAGSDGEVEAKSKDLVTHIQLVADDENYYLFEPDDYAQLGAVIFKIGSGAKYGEQLNINLITGKDFEDVTNISLATGMESTETEDYDTEGQSQAYYPADTTEVNGVEVMTKYTVTYFDGVEDEDITVPAPHAKFHNMAQSLDPTVPSRSGYTFNGWLGSDGETYENNGIYTGNADLELTAQWKPIQLTITWMDGEDVLGTTTVDYGTVPSYTAPTKEPTAQFTYTFAGWTSEEITVPTTTLPAATKDTTYYAQFTETTNTYTVTWYNQDGSKALEEDSAVKYGDEPVFDSDDPVKTADAQFTYTFAGWATSANQESGTLEENLPTVSGKTEYFAAFSKVLNEYTVTFNLNGIGEQEVAAQIVEYGKTATEPTDPVADHYTFDNWYLEEDLSGNAYDFFTPVTGDVTLYARWVPNIYKVTFDYGEASAEPSEKNANYGDTVTLTTPDIAAPIGKVFDGWLDEATNTKYNAGATITVSGNITLTAQWAFNPYTISVDQDVQNGTVSVDKQSANYGDTITVTAKPAEGYEIEKVTYQSTDMTYAWEIEAVDGIYSFTMPDADVTVSATFKAIDYKVEIGKIDNGSVTAKDSEGNEITTANVGDEIILTPAPADGYKDVTYTVSYKVTENGEEVTKTVDVTDNKFTMPAADVEVTATFAGIDYTVTFNQNAEDASGTVNNITATFGQSIQLGDGVYSRTGYTFLGWATVAENATTIYEAGTSITDTIFTPTDEGLSVTLYAVWKANTYDVTLDAKGGKVNGKETDTISVTYDSAYGDKLVDAARDGYTFAGWYMEANYTNKVETTTVVTTADKHTLYAKWTPNEYTVTLNHNYEGSTNGSITVTYDDIYSGLTEPTRPGYTFNGWYDAQSGGNKVENGNTVKITDDTTLYAQWTAIEYKITFDFAGGTIASSHEWPEGMVYENNVLTYTIESTATLPEAFWQMREFSGWLAKYEEGVDQNWCVADSDGKIEDTVYNAESSITGKYGNITLVAQWTRTTKAVVEEYKYAAAGYWMLRVGETVHEKMARKFGDELMYYTTDANYKVNTDDAGAYYTLIPVEKDGVTYIDTEKGELTNEGYEKMKVTSTNAGTNPRLTIDYNGDVNGDEVVNIADANVVYQMTIYGGAYYNSLTVEQRLAADMVKYTNQADKRASIEDVHAIVNIINGVSNTTN